MKAAASLNLPAQLGHTAEHVPARKNGDDWLAGANDAIGNIPTPVNADCYGKGWLVRIRSYRKPDLLTADAYRNTLGG